MLIDVNGVIYRVGTSTTTLTEVANEPGPITLHTHLLVREDQMALYGFALAMSCSSSKPLSP